MTERGRQGRLFTSSIRFRLLVWFVALLSLATVASVIVVREFLYRRVDVNIDQELVLESRELRALASGNDPETGEPFRGRVRRIFEVYLERNFPSKSEALITFVDGRPFLRSRQVTPYRLDTDPRLVEQWAETQRSERGRVETPAGEVDYLAVPVKFGRETRGVLVIAWFRDPELQEVAPAIAGAAAIGVIVLLFGSILAWRLATKILDPVSSVRRAARSIGESDLTKRIEVTGDDEISQLAGAFNDMLDRIETAFVTQRHFIDDASHELRTPITVIRGHLELLDTDPGERERTMALVMDELDRMARIVNDLLLLARARLPDFLVLDTLDVGSLTSDIHSKVVAIAPRDWRIESLGQGRVVADRQRLTQALIQLAQNASQHTEEGQVISIGSSVSNGFARLWVEDSGPGIPPSQRERLFDRFARGRGASKSEGAGLGLAIVRAIAEAHHGSVEVHSETGAGSRFTITLPLDQPVGPEVTQG